MSVSFARKLSRFFKKIGLIGYSKKRNIFGLHPLLISTLYIGLTLALASLLRFLIHLVFEIRNWGNNVYKQMLLEIVATLELCGACYELIIVADNWGVTVYAIYLFVLTLWWSQYAWQASALSACPYSAIESVVECQSDVSTAALLITAQTIGGLATFRYYVQLLWAMELAETHRGRAFQKCTADLQVHYAVGALVEGVATCLTRIVSRTLSSVNVKYAVILDALYATVMVVAAFNYSGGYLNPALATGLKLGCRGNTFFEHVTVYWIGSIGGAILAIFLCRTALVQNYINTLKIKYE